MLGAIPGIIGAASSLFGGGGGREIDPVQFATSQIQWRVKDAEQAGVHPLYALGANLLQPPPTSVGGDSGIGDRLAGAGQDIGRAIEALTSGSERTQARLDALAIQRGELENQLLASQIAKMNQPSNGPPLPPDAYLYQSGPPIGASRLPDRRVSTAPLIDGQGSGLVETVPSEVVSPRPNALWQEAGEHPYNKWVQGPNNELLPLPGKGMNLDDIDLSNPVAMEWWLRNRLGPLLPTGELLPPPDRELPRGALGWRFNPRTGGYSPYFNMPKPGGRAEAYQYRPRQ